MSAAGSMGRGDSHEAKPRTSACDGEGHAHDHSHAAGRAHSHAHRHAHARSQASSRLLLTLALAASYMLAEVVGGYLTNSLALLADAGHMLSDVAALAISLAAIQAARRAPSPSRTYGYHRAEVLGALVNALALMMVAGGILLEAVRRFGDPPHVDAPVALAVAVGGLLINLASLYVLGGHDGHADAGVGVRAAWLHIVADALGSVGAIASAALIWAAGWYWADPAASLLIAALVVYSALTLLLEVLNVLMEGSPRHIDVSRVRASIAALPDVRGVHDLHVWTITSGMESLSGHVLVATGARPQKVLAEVRSLLHERYGITHVTIQIEEDELEEHHICP